MRGTDLGQRMHKVFNPQESKLQSSSLSRSVQRSKRYNDELTDKEIQLFKLMSFKTPTQIRQELNKAPDYVNEQAIQDEALNTQPSIKGSYGKPEKLKQEKTEEQEKPLFTKSEIPIRSTQAELALESNRKIVHDLEVLNEVDD